MLYIASYVARICGSLHTIVMYVCVHVYVRIHVCVYMCVCVHGCVCCMSTTVCYSWSKCMHAYYYMIVQNDCMANYRASLVQDVAPRVIV